MFCCVIIKSLKYFSDYLLASRCPVSHMTRFSSKSAVNFYSVIIQLLTLYICILLLMVFQFAVHVQCNKSSFAVLTVRLESVMVFIFLILRPIHIVSVQYYICDMNFIII